MIRKAQWVMSLAVALVALAPLTSAAVPVEFTVGVLDGGGLIFHQTEVHSLLELRHKNVMIQQRDYSCGAASLATLFNYYLNSPVKEIEIIQTLLELNKKKGTLEEVVRRKGFSLLDLKMFAEERGFKAVGYRLDFEDLAKLGVQSIVPIIPEGYKHFVVFRGADQKRVYLADPSFGNLTESIDQFKKDWYGFTNVALAFFPPGSESRIGQQPLVTSELDHVFAGQDDVDSLLYTQPPVRQFIPGEF